MKLLRILTIALVIAAPSAQAQLNQLFGALQSAQTVITQGKQLLPQTAASSTQTSPQQLMNDKEREAKEYSDRLTAAAQAQEQARQQRQREAAQKASAEMDAEDQATIRASARRDEERQQRDAAEAQSTPLPCPDANPKLGTGGYLVDCKNKGATEQQMLARLGMLAPVQQAIFADIIQDIFDNNVTDIRKGNAIADYDFRCTAQNNCQRKVW
jgi:hypothetical protein